MIIPTNYESIFKSRILLITGIGRSGTTILGKLIASMENVFYIFEPAILKYYINAAIVTDYQVTGMFKEVLRGILFEDYFMPLVAGRSINPNPDEWTYGENHWATSVSRLGSMNDLSRRGKVISYVKKESPIFVIKTLEQQLVKSVLAEFFPDCQILHIIRNGFDVVASSVNRNWHTNKYYNNDIIDWVTRPAAGRVNCPLYIDEPSRDYWSRWGPVTRAACTWRTLMETTDGIAISYEDLCKKPEHYVGWLQKEYKVKRTAITSDHIKSIKEHKQGRKTKLSLDDIEFPETDKFAATMEKFGYL